MSVLSHSYHICSYTYIWNFSDGMRAIVYIYILGHIFNSVCFNNRQRDNEKRWTKNILHFSNLHSFFSQCIFAVFVFFRLFAPHRIGPDLCCFVLYLFLSAVSKCDHIADFLAMWMAFYVGCDFDSDSFLSFNWNETIFFTFLTEWSFNAVKLDTYYFPKMAFCIRIIMLLCY